MIYNIFGTVSNFSGTTIELNFIDLGRHSDNILDDTGYTCITEMYCVNKPTENTRPKLM